LQPKLFIRVAFFIYFLTLKMAAVISTEMMVIVHHIPGVTSRNLMLLMLFSEHAAFCKTFLLLAGIALSV
jgi:hypothetical protein